MCGVLSVTRQRTDEGHYRSLGRIDEMHVVGVSSGRVKGQDHEWMFEDRGEAVDNVSPKELELAGVELDFGSILYDKQGATFQDQEVFIATLVEVPRYWSIDAKYARTGGGLVGQPHVDEHRF